MIKLQAGQRNSISNSVPSEFEGRMSPGRVRAARSGRFAWASLQAETKTAGRRIGLVVTFRVWKIE